MHITEVVLTEQRNALAVEYDTLTGDITSDLEQAWRALENETNAMLKVVLNQLEPEYVGGQPYTTARDMCADMESGVLKISVDNLEHPLWTREHNLNFRLVHDAVGHWGLGTQHNRFNFAGEQAAYVEQARHMTNPLARRALYTEVVGQAAFRGTFGYFPTQKLGFIK